jgi:hypothetical protein
MLSLGGPRDAETFVNLASKVAAQSGFDPLVVSTQNTLAADPFFLDRLANYVDLVDQIKAIVASVKAAVAIPPDLVPTVAAPLALPQPMSLTADLTAEQSLPISKDGFYCIPWVKCSPWHESQPWDWYGDAKGAEALWPDSLFDVLASVGLGYYTSVTGAAAYLSLDAYVEILPDFTHVPFLAVARENRTEIGLANPGAANYAFELMAPDGTVANWFLTPRNSSLFDKLLNSGAAKRSLYSAATDAHVQSLGATNSLVRFNRYPDIRTARGVALVVQSENPDTVSQDNVTSCGTRGFSSVRSCSPWLVAPLSPSMSPRNTVTFLRPSCGNITHRRVWCCGRGSF